MLCGVQFTDVLGGTVVVTALPRMLADLWATPLQGSAVVTAYAMFFGGLLMVASRVGDRVGHRRIVLAALVLFAAASALGALAQSVWVLATARALQGMAAAASVPAALRLLTTVVPAGTARRRAVAGWSAAGAAAGASGFVLGGLLTEFASWRATFAVFIVLAAVLGAGIVAVIPRDHPLPGDTAWASGVLLTGAAMGIVAGATLVGGGHWTRLGGALAATGLAAAAGFVLVERRSANPLVSPAAWRSAPLRWGAFGSFSNTATTSSSITVATFYLQGQLGLSPLRAGGLLVCFSVMVVAGSAAAPRLITNLGWGRALGCGLGTIAVGNMLFVVWPEVVGIGLAAATTGLGIGIGSVAATDMGTSVSEAIKATAAGMLNTAAQLGTAIGTALVLVAAATFEPRVAWMVTVVLAGVTALTTARGSPTRSDIGGHQSDDALQS